MIQIGYKSFNDMHHIRKLVIQIMVIIFVGGFMSACDSTPATISPSPTATVKPPATQTTLPPIPTNILSSSDPQWREVLHFDHSQNDTVKVLGGTFVATNPYSILVVCEGSGTLLITFSPQGAMPVRCTSTPLLQRTVVGTSQSPPKRETINVTLAPQGNIIWKVSVQVQQ